MGVVKGNTRSIAEFMKPPPCNTKPETLKPSPLMGPAFPIVTPTARAKHHGGAHKVWGFKRRKVAALPDTCLEKMPLLRENSSSTVCFAWLQALKGWTERGSCSSARWQRKRERVGPGILPRRPRSNSNQERGADMVAEESETFLEPEDREWLQFGQSAC